MKKTAVYAGISLLLIACMALAGCGKNDETSIEKLKLDEYVTLPTYDTISIPKAEYDLGLAYAKYKPLSEVEGLITNKELTEGTVQALDSVNISYIGKKDGTAFEGGTSDSYDLVIGSSSFIKGFEGGLIGAKVGQTLDLNLTFPSSYSSADLAGKDVVFTVTVKKITRPVVPEVTDDVAKKASYTNLAAYEKTTKEKYDQDCAWTYIMNALKVEKYPEKLIDQEVDKQMEELNQNCSSNNTTPDALLSANGYTLETYTAAVRSQAQSNMSQRMAMNAIAQKEKLEITDADVEKYVTDNYSGKAATDEDKASIRESLLFEKVIAKLAQNVKVGA